MNLGGGECGTLDILLSNLRSKVIGKSFKPSKRKEQINYIWTRIKSMSDFSIVILNTKEKKSNPNTSLMLGVKSQENKKGKEKMPLKTISKQVAK